MSTLAVILWSGGVVSAALAGFAIGRQRAGERGDPARHTRSTAVPADPVAPPASDAGVNVDDDRRRDLARVLELAREAEHEAQRLGGLAEADPTHADGDERAQLEAVLRSTADLLRRAGRVNGDEAAPPERDGSEPRPVVLELIAARDMVMAVAEGDGELTRDHVRMLDGKLVRMLEKAGVRVLDSRGDPLDYRFQDAQGIRPTGDPRQDEHVCDTIRPGYALGDRVLRPQVVTIYQYEAVEP